MVNGDAGGGGSAGADLLEDRANRREINLIVRPLKRASALRRRLTRVWRSSPRATALRAAHQESFLFDRKTRRRSRTRATQPQRTTNAKPNRIATAPPILQILRLMKCHCQYPRLGAGSLSKPIICAERPSAMEQYVTHAAAVTSADAKISRTPLTASCADPLIQIGWEAWIEN